jgi:hypothetical protein
MVEAIYVNEFSTAIASSHQAHEEYLQKYLPPGTWYSSKNIVGGQPQG